MKSIGKFLIEDRVGKNSKLEVKEGSARLLPARGFIVIN